MRFVDGEDLATRSRRDGPLARRAAADRRPGRLGARRRPRARARPPRRQAGEHPARRRDDHAYLTDFGLTKRVAGGPAETADGPVRRHARLRRARADPRRARSTRAPTSTRSACVLFHALTGDVPFPCETDEAQALGARIRTAAARVASAGGVPEAVDAGHRPRDGQGPGRALPLGRRARRTARRERRRPGDAPAVRAAPRAAEPAGPRPVVGAAETARGGSRRSWSSGRCARRSASRCSPAPRGGFVLGLMPAVLAVRSRLRRLGWAIPATATCAGTRGGARGRLPGLAARVRPGGRGA